MANSYEAEGATQRDLLYNDRLAQADELRREKQAMRIQAATTRAVDLAQLQQSPAAAKTEPETDSGQPIAEEQEQESGDSYRAPSYRERLQAARKAKDKHVSSLSMATAPVRNGVSNLLADAWLAVLVDWGVFSLLWINIHAFMSMIMPDVFVKLGHEWLGQIPGGNMASKGARRTAKEVGESIGLIEKMGLFFLDAVVLIVFLLIVAVIAVILIPLIPVLKALDFLGPIGDAFIGIWKIFSGI